MHIYRSPGRDIDLPSIDLLTYLFDSEWSRAQDHTVLHVEAGNDGNCITKAEARLLVQRIAYVLRNEYDIGRHGPGKDVVLFTSSGNPFAPIFICAVVAAGGVLSAASTAFTKGELVRQTKAGDAKSMVCSPDLIDKTTATANECGIPRERLLVLDHATPGKWKLNAAAGGRSFPEANGPTLNWPRITDLKALRETPICLLYSSGTTGLPKGVELSHSNCVHSCLSYLHHCATEFMSAYDAEGRPFEYRTIAHLPLAHIAGIQQFLLHPFVLGGTVYWMQKYNLPDFLKYSKQYRTTYQMTVPPIWLQIAKSLDVTDHFDTLEVALTGAAPMGQELQAEVSRKLGKGRVLVGQTWGATEVCGSITAQPWHLDDTTGSVGVLMLNTRARIVNEDDRDVEPGQPGEVLLQSPGLTRGYHNNDEANLDAFVDGWYRTGDVAVIKGDKVYLVDRRKELIKFKGLQVAPAELEALLITHPGVLDAAVIGIESEQWQTEVPRAYVVAKKDHPPSEADIKAFVKEHLAEYKQLRGGVVFVDEIPKSPSGKILRKDLRLRVAQEKKNK